MLNYTNVSALGFSDTDHVSVTKTFLMLPLVKILPDFSQMNSLIHIESETSWVILALAQRELSEVTATFSSLLKLWLSVHHNHLSFRSKWN